MHGFNIIHITGHNKTNSNNVAVVA